MDIYIGNIPWSIGNEELRALFAEIGCVEDARLILDPKTGNSRGFGFVTMSDADGQRAIERLHGIELGGRTLKIHDAAKHQKSRKASAPPGQETT